MPIELPNLLYGGLLTCLLNSQSNLWRVADMPTELPNLLYRGLMTCLVYSPPPPPPVFYGVLLTCSLALIWDLSSPLIGAINGPVRQVLISPPIRHQRFIRCKVSFSIHRRKGGRSIEENQKQKREKEGKRKRTKQRAERKMRKK